jgi:hypothetical protein
MAEPQGCSYLKEWWTESRKRVAKPDKKKFDAMIALVERSMETTQCQGFRRGAKTTIDGASGGGNRGRVQALGVSEKRREHN